MVTHSKPLSCEALNLQDMLVQQLAGMVDNYSRDLFPLDEPLRAICRLASSYRRLFVLDSLDSWRNSSVDSQNRTATRAF